MCRRLLGKKSANSVTRLGHIWKFFGTKFLSKVAQIFSNNFGLLWKIELFTLNWCGYFLCNFYKNWATFYSNIWSHWVPMTSTHHSFISLPASFFIKPHYYSNGFYWGHQCSWILTTGNSMQVSNIQSDNHNRSLPVWPDGFSTFGHLNQWKFAQWHTKFAKIGPKFSQIVNKSSKIALDFEDFTKMAKFRHIWWYWSLPASFSEVQL